MKQSHPFLASEVLPIKGFLEVSLIDFPLAEPGSVIFLGGCNARCVYCQASHMVDSAGRGIPSIELKAVLACLEELRGFVKGVTVTGGEATLYERLPELLLHPLRQMGFKIKVDTYGPIPERVDVWIKQGFVQCLGVDIKGPWSRYHKITQLPFTSGHLQKINKWVRALISRPWVVTCEFRTTVHPSLLSIDDIFETAEQVRGAEVYVLQNYKPISGFDPSLQSKPLYSLDILREVARAIQDRRIVQRCFVRGFERDVLKYEEAACEF